MTERISLYGDDAEQFREMKERVAEQRNGNEPGNAEMVRLLMHEVTADDLRGGLV